MRENMLLMMAGILLFLGLTLLAAEAILPLHGTSAVGGLAAIAASVAMFFARSTWAGLGALAGSFLLLPIVWLWMVWVWPMTPVGRRVLLGPVRNQPMAPEVGVGMRGVVLTELRPGGICEFGSVRVAAMSESGFLEAGKIVRVVGMNGVRPRVRVEEQG